jgi:Ca-activated chloride channel family protein
VLLNELTDDDRVTLIAVGSEVDVVVPLTNDRLAIDQAVHALDAWGSTALHDAVVQAVDAIEPAPGRRALVLVSDGMERHSLRTAEDVYARIRQSDVMIYPVAFARRMPPVFRAMGALSGGRASVTRNPEELARLFRRFAEELRHQYLLGYTPDGPETPGYRTIAVRVRRPGLTVRARAGYTVPSR